MKKVLFLIIVLMTCCTSMKEENGKDYTDNYQRAAEAFDREDFEETMKYLKMELDNYPKNGHAWTLMSAVHMSNKEFDDAISTAKVALKLLSKKDSTSVGYAHKLLSLSYYCMNKDESALEEITLAIKADPKESQYLEIRGHLYYEDGQYDLSVADYEKYIAMEPDNTSGFVGLSRNLTIQKKYDEALDKINYVIERDSNDLQLYVLRAKCLLGVGNNPEAARDIVKAMDMELTEEAITMMISCSDSCYQHLAALMKSKVDHNSKSEDWPYLLGVTHETHDHFKEAIPYYLKSLQEKGSCMTCRNIAKCYGEMGDFPSALHYIDMAIDMDSTNAHYIRLKADFHYYNGDYQEALESITRFIGMEKEEGAPYGYYRRGFYKDNLHNVDGAIADYSESILLDPSYAYAYLGRGDMYLQKGNKMAAEKDFRKVLELDSVICGQGNCKQYAYLMLGMRDSAEVWMQQILEKYPTPSNYYDAACLMARMGEKERSVEYLKMAFESGYHEFHHVEIDDDLDNLREMDEFKSLMEKYRKMMDDDEKEG